MTRRQVLKLVLLPVLVGLVAVSGTYALVQRVAPEPPEEVQVVAAARAVAAGTTLAASDLVLKAVPPALTGPETMSDLSQVVGKVTRVPLVPGELVFRSKLVLPGGGAGLGTHVPPGYRAVTVAADEVKAVAGLLQPGDRVDVIATFSQEVAGAEKTRLLLEDVQVLAVGKATEVAAGGRDAGELRSVTLAVTPEQAIALTLAEETGRIRLALRPVAGEWTRGEIELTTSSFAAGGTARLRPSAGPPFRGTAAVFEVPSPLLTTLGLGPRWPPGMGERDAAFLRALDSLVSTGKARVVARRDLVGGSGAPVRWELESSVPVTGRGSLSWLNYGFSLEVLVAGADNRSRSLTGAAQLRYLDIPKERAEDGSGVAYPIEEVRPGAERLTANISLGAGNCLIVYGLLGPQCLTAPEGFSRLALPAVLRSEQVIRGNSEMLVVLWVGP